MWTTRIDRAAVKTAVRANFTRLRKDYVFALGVVIALAALAALTQTIAIAVSRMAYPFTLEWMEGGTMDHIRLVLAGKPMYRKPSVEWTPAIYTPFYYWTCAAFMKVFGVSMFWARFVSTCSLFATFCLIGQFIRKEVGGVVGPLVGAGLYAISFPITGAWVDLARVDSLFFVLFLAGAYSARHGTTWVSAVAAGALLFLGFFTKQTGLILAMPVLAGSILISWRRGLIAAGVFAGLTIGTVQWMDLSSDGWFHYYVFEVARKHSLPPTNEWKHFVLVSMWEPMPMALAMAVGALVCGAVKGWRASAFYLGTLIAAGVAGFASLAKNGGFPNAMIPYCGVVATLCGMTVAWTLRHTTDSTVGRRMQAAVAAVLLLQFAELTYDQRRFVPRRRDEASGRAMIERWRKLHERGSVYSFGFGYYDFLAGGEGVHAHAMAIVDILRTDDPARVPELKAELLAAIRNRRYRTIVYDESCIFAGPELKQAIEASYRRDVDLFSPADADRTWPRTGFGARPNQIWLAP